MHSVAATSTNREVGVGTIIDGTKKLYNKNGGINIKKRLRLYYVPIIYMCVWEGNIIGEQLKPANMIYIYHIRRWYDI